MHILFSLRKPEGAGKGPISGRTLMYDAQSKCYIFSEDTLEGTTCSICLEFLGKQAEQLDHFGVQASTVKILTSVPMILQYLRMTR